ncbi:MAG TPA: hypothetical protein VGR57_14950, partial [Ktedonobacterales bacterium]|nr:hypothetical protein [Ktedonobacterales bacterium]
IVARTGMQPRTCTLALMREPSTTHSGRWWALAFKYGLPLTLFVMSLAAAALPLTPFVALNAYAAVTSAVLGVAAASAMWKPDGSPHPAYYALPAAPTLPDESVGITYRARRAGRWQDVLIGVLLSMNVVPAVVALVTPPASPPAAFAAKVDAGLLFIIVLIGVAAIIDGLSRKRTRLTITSTSLTETQGRKSTRLAWEEIVGLSVQMSEGAPAPFTALGADGETISWPARRVMWQAQGGSPGPILPEELAALVAARSGVRLTIE